MTTREPASRNRSKVAAAESGQATYVYCLVRAGRARVGGRTPTGLPGAGVVRRLDAGDGLWLVVADAPLERYGSAPIEEGLRDLAWVSRCALAHEAVVEHFARCGAIAPMKLFTLFSSDQRALAHVARQRRRIDRALDRVTGCEEWGVRVAFDQLAARREAGARAAPRVDGARSGTDFLRGKQRDRDEARRIVEGARACADETWKQLSAKSSDARRRPIPADAVVAGARGRVLLDAVFLVPASRATRFRAAVAAISSRLGGGGREITLTGPWPPYSFLQGAS